jgi:hypothetical protein
MAKCICKPNDPLGGTVTSKASYGAVASVMSEQLFPTIVATS